MRELNTIASETLDPDCLIGLKDGHPVRVPVAENIGGPTDDGFGGGEGGAGSVPAAVAASRSLSNADNGKVLECATTLTLTLPAGLEPGFACVVIPNGTTSIAVSGGASINGAATTLTRAAATNRMFAIQSLSSADSYVVSGA